MQEVSGGQQSKTNREEKWIIIILEVHQLFQLHIELKNGYLLFLSMEENTRGGHCSWIYIKLKYYHHEHKQLTTPFLL